MKNIILLAAPAAGKGTLAKTLKEKYNLAHISTGDLLRDATKKEDELSKQIADMMAKGLLVTDEIIYELLERRLQEEDCKNGYILDGFPRTKVQAEKYAELLKELGKDLGVVIYIDIDKDMAIKRACSRITCPKCGRIYNKYSNEMKPKVEGMCDDCNVKLTQRADDTEETFVKRFDEYMTKTMPLYDYYKDLGVLKTIKAYESKFDTFNEAVKVLEEK